jgi:hypothetical protein
MSVNRSGTQTHFTYIHDNFKKNLMSVNYSTDFYRSVKSLSLFAVGGLAVIAACQLLALFFGLGQIISPDSIVESFAVEGEPDTSFWQLLQGLVYLLQLPVYIFTIVFFLIWLNRAHKNLAPLRAQNMEFSSGWAVGWWFIPFANLVKPYQVMQEVWRESDPDFDAGSGFLSNSAGTAPGYMSLWWAFWIISNIFSNICSRVYDPENMSTVAISGYLFVITGIVSIIAAVLAIKVVRDITRRQDERYENLGPLNENQPPSPPSFDTPNYAQA